MICCKNIVDVTFFKNSFPDFGNHYLFIFPLIFGNDITTIATIFFFPISAIALPQLIFGQFGQ